MYADICKKRDLKHWQHEIDVAKQSISDRVDELKKRGDKYE